jgi:hypothetical protein
VTNVAATGVNFAKLMREPFSRPTAAAHRTMSTKPSAQIPGDFPSRTKKEARTTRKPASGPTERSMPPSNSANVCPSEMKPSAAHANVTDVMLKSEM